MKPRQKEKHMRAIILAAGRGSRLQHLTDHRPKCLVEFQGEALIDRAIRSLRNGGVEKITVLVGYQPMALQSRLDTGKIDELVVNERWQETNMVATLMLADRQLRTEPALVVYGDIFFGPEIVRDLCNSTGPLSVAYDPHGVALWAARFEDPLQDIEDLRLAPDGRIESIGAPVTSLADPQGQYMGLLTFTPEAYSAMLKAVEDDSTTRADMTTTLQRMIDAGLPVLSVPNRTPWGEIDSPDDLRFFSDRAELNA
jgi:choline kinase